MITVAALLQLVTRTASEKAEEYMRTMGRIALITHGSPLASLYGRFFPAYFSREDLKEIRRALTYTRGVRWRNLYRRTDPIGKELSVDDVVDIEIFDPPAIKPEPGDPFPAPLGHSNCYLDPSYWELVDELSAMLPIDRASVTANASRAEIS